MSGAEFGNRNLTILITVNLYPLSHLILVKEVLASGAL
jgi:hypothetical protein